MNDEKKSDQYSISDLSKEFEVTTRSIRHYEDYGLISPLRKGTHRIYTNSDRVRLQLILRGKNVGFSLAEIKEIIELYKMPHGEEKQTQYLLAKIELRRAMLKEQLVNIETMLTELDRLEERIDSTQSQTL